MENYGKYISEEIITVTSKNYYSDNKGFPNEKAFCHKLITQQKLVQQPNARRLLNELLISISIVKEITHR